MIKVGIQEISFCLGAESLSNKALQMEKPEWPVKQLAERTGVETRAIASSSETALDLGEKATRKLFKKSQVSIEEIDALIFCTQSPDHVLPPNSTLLHGRLGLSDKVMAFDISHACSGFIYGLGIARSLVISESASKVLLVNADTYSRYLHEDDRSTRGIFGDGAAATLITKTDPLLTITDLTYGTSGKNANRFIIKCGGSKYPTKQLNQEQTTNDPTVGERSDHHINMDGMGVLSFFNSVIPPAVNNILERNSLTTEDVRYFVFHQASKLGLDGLQRSLSIPAEKMVFEMSDTGNLVSASIPTALARVIASQKPKKGDIIVLCGFGVGLSWGAAIAIYNGDS